MNMFLDCDLCVTKMCWHVQGNCVSQLEGLSQLRGLLHLNLSRNRLTQIASLSTLTQLRHLNLDCNHITSLAGAFTCYVALELYGMRTWTLFPKCSASPSTHILVQSSPLEV